MIQGIKDEKIALGLLLLGCSGLSAAADAMKIGVVDLQKIIQTSSQIQKIQQGLEQRFRPRRDNLMATEKDLKAKIESFKKDSVVMSANQRKDKEREIVSMQQKFELDGQKYQQELSSAHNEAMEDFYTKVRSAISVVAKKDSYSIILQKDAVPFSTEMMDVTKQVIAEIH